MNLHLKDRVIMVTGGAGLHGSIGETVVRHIIEEGGIPVFVDKHPRGQHKQQELREEGHDCLFVQADLTMAEDCEKSVEMAVDYYGRLEGIVHNLGVNDGVGLNRSYDEFMDSLKLNLAHLFGVTKAAVPHLGRTSGPIVNIASKVALTGQGGTSGYAAAKGGMLALTREWALDLRNEGIRVNAVVVAESWTPGYKEWLKKFEHPDTRKKEISSKIPLAGRMTEPDEVADAVLFLLSDRASHITGQFVHVDGGYVHLDRALT